MDWVSAVQHAVDYMEDHITEPLDYETIAKQGYASLFHFQRMFHILCGCTVGEYLRNRRLSLAAEELASGNDRVVDIAGKYGYESPDSFTRAFQKFHGATPSQVRGAGVPPRNFGPLRIKVQVEGGGTMGFRVEEKEEMLLTGYKKRFSGDRGDKRAQDHEFACENRVLQYILEGISREHEITYQILTNFGPDGYDFYFASKLPPWALAAFDEDLGEMANNFEHISVPAGTYLVCETARCEFPTTLVDALRRRAVTEWLPSSGYVLRDAPELGVIHWFFEDGSDRVNTSRYCELWLPIVKADQAEETT